MNDRFKFRVWSKKYNEYIKKLVINVIFNERTNNETTIYIFNKGNRR